LRAELTLGGFINIGFNGDAVWSLVVGGCVAAREGSPCTPSSSVGWVTTDCVLFWFNQAVLCASCDLLGGLLRCSRGRGGTLAGSLVLNRANWNLEEVIHVASLMQVARARGMSLRTSYLAGTAEDSKEFLLMTGNIIAIPECLQKCRTKGKGAQVRRIKQCLA